MPIYKLTEYSDNYPKKSGILWQYCRDEPDLAADGIIADFTTDDATIDSFKIKGKITGKTGNDSIANVEIMVPLNYLNNFWRIL